MQYDPTGRSGRNPMLIAGVAGAVLLGALVCCGAGAALFLVRGGSTESAPVLSPTPEPEVSSASDEAQREADAQRQLAEEQRAQAEATAAAVAAEPPGDPLAGAGVVNVTMTVVTSSGLTGLPRGTTCTFPVTRGDASDGLNCRAAVGCNGLHLYGALDTNGFFTCSTFSTSPPAVVGADTSTTSSDRDPSFALDTRAGTISIADDASGTLGAFSVTGTVTVAGGPSEAAGS